MQQVMLGTDVVLQAIIGPADAAIKSLMAQARNGEIELILMHSVLFWAVRSVRSDDAVDAERFSELLKYSQIVADEPEYLGPQERELWEPKSEEIEKWRSLALAKQGTVAD